MYVLKWYKSKRTIENYDTLYYIKRKSSQSMKLFFRTRLSTCVL